MFSIKLAIFGLLVVGALVHADPAAEREGKAKPKERDTKGKEVVALEDARKQQYQEVQQGGWVQEQQPQGWGQAQSWSNGEDQQMVAMPAAYGYQRYPYYAAPAGNAFMQPRGFPQMAYQAQPQQQVQAYQQTYQQPFQTLPMQVAYQQPQQLQYAQAYQPQQAWQTLPEYVGGSNYEFSSGQVQSEASGVESGRVEEVPTGAMSSLSMQQPQANAWNPAAPVSGNSWPMDSATPTWRRSFEPINGRPGCYNRCRPSCSNAWGGCQPTCRSACNIRPTCPRRSEVQYSGSTMVCARPGYNFQGAQGAQGPYYGQQQNAGFGGGWYDATSWGGAVNQGYPVAAQPQVAKLSKAQSKSEIEVVDESS